MNDNQNVAEGDEQAVASTHGLEVFWQIWAGVANERTSFTPGVETDV